MLQNRFQIRKICNQKKKLNNAGMSLVEVIISITILALVAIPVMRSLTSAMYYNAKARTRQSVTLSAESLMETFKGNSLEELQSLFQQAQTGDDSTKAAARAALGITGADEFVYPTDLTTDDPLTFRVNGMQSDDGNTTCDIEVTATKQDVATIMEIDNILPTRDAIFRADLGYNSMAWDKALADFQANYQTAFLDKLKELDERERELTLSDIDLSHLTLYQRELIFNVSNDGTNDVVTASMVYSYYIKEHIYYEKVVTPAPGDPAEGEAESEAESESESETVSYDEKTFNYPENTADYFKVVMPLSDYPSAPTSGEYTVYTNPVDGGVHPLQRLMIYYYPVYDLERDEVIIVKNNAGLNLDCYLIKQKNAGLSNAQLEWKETNYKPNVNRTGSGNVVLYHNLNTNLGGNSSPGGAGHIATFSDVKDYAGNSFKVQKVLVYKLEMKVFRDSTEIASFEGTMNEYMDD